MINKLEKLIIATGNKGKFEELKAMLSGANKNFADEIIFAPEFAEQINIVEDGSSYEENAEIKARAWAEISGLSCLADDSGLEVEALNGAPGLFSARATKGDKVQWILNQLDGIENRKAKFVASL
ncbi:MAG: non-canonical purine NTP pyrophosphatase, partial [Synergistaceae bacterium]|nr:non-canonical purine NTP pyrophosphatase [Synergistaceae bacterium]